MIIIILLYIRSCQSLSHIQRDSRLGPDSKYWLSRSPVLFFFLVIIIIIIIITFIIDIIIIIVFIKIAKFATSSHHLETISKRAVIKSIILIITFLKGIIGIFIDQQRFSIFMIIMIIAMIMIIINIMTIIASTHPAGKGYAKLQASSCVQLLILHLEDLPLLDSPSSLS